MQQQRHLAAILFTDIVGSTSMMQKDEQVAMSVHKRYMAVLKQNVLSHSGEVLNDFGDGSLCCFHSATEALRCAIEMQQQFQQEPKVPLRIGLHIGEIFFDDGKVFGDGVNVASRVQSLGIANSILFSSEISSKIKNQIEFKSVSLGRYHFKNVDEPVEVFALSNDGLVVPQRKQIEGKLHKEKSNRRTLIIATAVILLAATSFFIYRQYFKHAGFTGAQKSIAVLPFETVSSEKENEYISDGFTIDIINKLSKLSGLEGVPGWSSVKIFKNTKKTLIEIANQLGVDAVLTGTMQKQGDKLHVTAELTDINTGKTIWNMDDDKKWGDVLTLQSEVAQKIASSLSAHLTSEEKTGIKKQYTENTDAYNYYIKGRYFWDNRTPAAFDSAETNYKKAIDLDPNYALAYSGRADLFIYNQKGLSQLEAIPLARDYANKALSLDSNLVEALTTIGFIQSAFDYNWDKAKRTLEKAIHLNPNYAYAHIFYGNILQYTGENTERGLQEIKKASDLDPLSVSINWVLGRNYYYAGKLDSAEEQLKKAIGINSKYILAKATLARVLLDKRKYDDAFKLIRQLPEKGIAKTDYYQGPALSYAYAVSGNINQAQLELDKTVRENSYGSHSFIAQSYAALKNYYMAFSELDKAYEEKDLGLYFIKVDPAFLPIRNEPRFKALLKKINLE